ncbi:MAG: DUF4391 domain-containing protein [Thermodesulfobacteriota bacterium]
MNAAGIIAALDLPASALVGQRVPKKLLVENGAPTAADKRQINEGIEEIHWVAALKPTTAGVPEYRDEVREYLEIAVLSLDLRPKAKVGRLLELAHRAVPYPVFLVVFQGVDLTLSLAHKRWSQGEAGKAVLDGDVVAVSWDESMDSEHWGAFGKALALGRQPRANLFTVYQGWIDAVLALEAARVTGGFATPDSVEHSTARREALQECARLEMEIARLRSAAAKEKQLPRQVELNLELKRVQAQLAAAQTKL